MSAWLGRPNLIDQKNLSFRFPNLKLDQSATEPNLISPFAHMALQAQLGRRVAASLEVSDAIPTKLTADQVLSIESECDKFIEELPAIFRLEDPDTSLDERHPYFVFQRHQLHCVVLVTMLDFLKPFLTRDWRDKATDRDEEFRRMGVDIALRLLKVARKLFDHEFPINAKFHMVVFSIFDTATLLCSAIIHDQDHILPHREEVVDAIESSLDMLHQLSLTTKLGACSYRFLQKLVQATPDLSRKGSSGKRQKTKLSEVPTTSSVPLASSIPPPTTNIEAVSNGMISIDLLPPITTTDDLSFDLDQFLAQNPFGDIGDSTTLDMGGMEQIWDWEDLHLDGFSNSGPNS